MRIAQRRSPKVNPTTHRAMPSPASLLRHSRPQCDAMRERGYKARKFKAALPQCSLPKKTSATNGQGLEKATSANRPLSEDLERYYGSVRRPRLLLRLERGW